MPVLTSTFHYQIPNWPDPQYHSLYHVIYIYILQQTKYLPHSGEKQIVENILSTYPIVIPCDMLAKVLSQEDTLTIQSSSPPPTPPK